MAAIIAPGSAGTPKSESLKGGSFKATGLRLPLMPLPELRLPLTDEHAQA